jgi:hypothetical protein
MSTIHLYHAWNNARAATLLGSVRKGLSLCNMSVYRDQLTLRLDAVTCAKCKAPARSRCGGASKRKPGRRGAPMTKRRKLPREWRRQPSPDCPLCQGEGRVTINIYGPCGGKENTAPLRGSCPCVQIAGRRPDRRTLEKMRDEMKAAGQ